MYLRNIHLSGKIASIQSSQFARQQEHWLHTIRTVWKARLSYTPQWDLYAYLPRFHFHELHPVPLLDQKRIRTWETLRMEQSGAQGALWTLNIWEYLAMIKMIVRLSRNLEPWSDRNLSSLLIGKRKKSQKCTSLFEFALPLAS